MSAMIMIGGFLLLLLIAGRVLVARLVSPAPGARQKIRAGRGNPRRTAIHEAGHALIAWLSVYVTEVYHAKLRRVDGRVAGGNVRAMFVGLTEARLWDQISYDLGGIAAEIHVYGNMFPGDARKDIAGAYEEAERMVARERRQGRALIQPWDDGASPANQRLDFTRMFQGPVDPRVHEILQICYRRARFLIGRHEDRVHAVADALLEKTTLDEDGLREVLGRRPFVLFRGLR